MNQINNQPLHCFPVALINSLEWIIIIDFSILLEDELSNRNDSTLINADQDPGGLVFGFLNQRYFMREETFFVLTSSAL
jgi:hypothetical protein